MKQISDVEIDWQTSFGYHRNQSRWKSSNSNTKHFSEFFLLSNQYRPQCVDALFAFLTLIWRLSLCLFTRNSPVSVRIHCWNCFFFRSTRGSDGDYLHTRGSLMYRLLLLYVLLLSWLITYQPVPIVHWEYRYRHRRTNTRTHPSDCERWWW